MPPHSFFPGVENISLNQLCELPYKDQAVWYMNGFWEEIAAKLSDAEDIWVFFHHFVRLDLMQTPPKGEDGNELDQLMAAKFLEESLETLTAVERKTAMKEIDIDNNGKMALIEYLTYHFKKGVTEVIESNQGKASELEGANYVINQVLEMLPQIETKIASQKQALQDQLTALVQTRAAKVAVAEAYERQLQAEADLEQALIMLDASKLELQKAVDALRAEEQAVADKIVELEAKALDMTLGAVARGMAANQLMSLRNEDPLPLRKAKITQEAALRRVEREQKHASNKAIEAKEQVRQSILKAEELDRQEKDLLLKKEQLALAIQELEDTYVEMNDKMEEARRVIEELKKSPGAMGGIWWLERSLYEVDSFMPQSRQKYDHRKPFQFVPPAEGSEPVEEVTKYTKPSLAPKPKTKLVFSHSRGANKVEIDDGNSGGGGGDNAPAPFVRRGSVTVSTPLVMNVEDDVAVTKPAVVVADPVVDSVVTEPVPSSTAETTPLPPTADGPVDATLYYFPNLRGRAQTLMLALTEMKLNWQLKQCDYAQFLAMKPKLAYGSFPMLEIDGLHLVQSTSTLRYLSRSANNYPTTMASMWAFDALVDTCEDVRVMFSSAGKDADGTKKLREGVDRHLTQFAAVLGSGNYFVDNAFTFADLSVLDVLEIMCDKLGAGVLSKYSTLTEFKDRIEARPQVQEYLTSATRPAAPAAH
eukprot:m.120700 g.120700  ORF g.120700 m.120700 type:complete len:704 (-) comp28825_c0_seq1:138-2249(-)